jgi:large subunit ribosomal protein L29
MDKEQKLRDLSINELEANYEDERKKLFKLVNEKRQTKQFEKPHRIKQTRKQIARLLTIMTEKQSEIAKI